MKLEALKGGTDKVSLYCECGSEAGDTWQCGAGKMEGGDHRRTWDGNQSSQMGDNGMFLAALSLLPSLRLIE